MEVEFKSTNGITGTHTCRKRETEVDKDRETGTERQTQMNRQADRQTENRKDLIKQ